jgi:hypothetical protein
VHLQRIWTRLLSEVLYLLYFAPRFFVEFALLSLKVSTFRSTLFILFRPRFFVEFALLSLKVSTFRSILFISFRRPVFRRVRVAQSKGFYFPEYFIYFISPPVFRRVHGVSHFINCVKNYEREKKDWIVTTTTEHILGIAWHIYSTGTWIQDFFLLQFYQ